MAATHTATMTYARRLADSETPAGQESSGRSLMKLAKGYGEQVEVLKRYRKGGYQQLTVGHVTVNRGGQAIAGHVDNRAAVSAPAAGTVSGDLAAPDD